MWNASPSCLPQGLSCAILNDTSLSMPILVWLYTIILLMISFGLAGIIKGHWYHITCYGLLHIHIDYDLEYISHYDLLHLHMDNDLDYITCYDLLHIRMGTDLDQITCYGLLQIHINNDLDYISHYDLLHLHINKTLTISHAMTFYTSVWATTMTR